MPPVQKANDAISDSAEFSMLDMTTRACRQPLIQHDDPIVVQTRGLKPSNGIAQFNSDEVFELGGIFVVGNVPWLCHVAPTISRGVTVMMLHVHAVQRETLLHDLVSVLKFI